MTPIELVLRLARANSRMSRLWRVEVIDDLADFRLHSPKFVAGAGVSRPWGDFDVGHPIRSWLLVAPPTALLALLCLMRRETRVSPSFDEEVDAHRWVNAQRRKWCSGTPSLEWHHGFIVHMKGPVAIKVGRCPACVDRSLPGMRKLATHEWRRMLGPDAVDRVGGEIPVNAQVEHGSAPDGRMQMLAAYACPDCYGTGERWAEVGRLVLDASPRHHERLATPAKSDAFDALTVWADELQAAGDPLGEWTAQWLAGLDDWIREVPDAVARHLEEHGQA